MRCGRKWTICAATAIVGRSWRNRARQSRQGRDKGPGSAAEPPGAVKADRPSTSPCPQPQARVGSALKARAATSSKDRLIIGENNFCHRGTSHKCSFRQHRTFEETCVPARIQCMKINKKSTCSFLVSAELVRNPLPGTMVRRPATLQKEGAGIEEPRHFQ